MDTEREGKDQQTEEEEGEKQETKPTTGIRTKERNR